MGEFGESNASAVALPDAHPVAPNHTLVVPRCHVQSLYELDDFEQAAVWRLVAAVREHISRHHGAKDFNIGSNDGVAAGQTVPHAHVHIIPRRPHDVADPRGGIRWVIPDKAAYWERSATDE